MLQCNKSFTRIFSFDLHKYPMNSETMLFQFYRAGNWVTEWMSNLPKDPELVNSKVGMGSPRSTWVPSLNSYPPLLCSFRWSFWLSVTKDIEGKEGNPLEGGVRGRDAGNGTLVMRVGLRRKRWAWEGPGRWNGWDLVFDWTQGSRGGMREGERERSQRWFPDLWLVKLCRCHLRR